MSESFHNTKQLVENKGMISIKFNYKANALDIWPSQILAISHHQLMNYMDQSEERSGSFSSMSNGESLLTNEQSLSVDSLDFNSQLGNTSGLHNRKTDQEKRTSLDLQVIPVTIRPYCHSDRKSVFKLLGILPILYPGGYNWLEHRLDEVVLGKARCTLAVTQCGPVGVIIETPKHLSRLKLSTFYVHPAFRGLNIGTHLLHQSYEGWIRKELAQVHITADLKISNTLIPLLTRYGFRVKAIELARYGPNRDEIVLSWSPDSI